MAEIKITIRDLPNGEVEFSLVPFPEKADEPLTRAQELAKFAFTALATKLVGESRLHATTPEIVRSVDDDCLPAKRIVTLLRENEQMEAVVYRVERDNNTGDEVLVISSVCAEEKGPRFAYGRLWSILHRAGLLRFFDRIKLVTPKEFTRN